MYNDEIIGIKLFFKVSVLNCFCFEIDPNHQQCFCFVYSENLEIH